MTTKRCRSNRPAPIPMDNRTAELLAVAEDDIAEVKKLWPYIREYRRREQRCPAQSAECVFEQGDNCGSRLFRQVAKSEEAADTQALTEVLDALDRLHRAVRALAARAPVLAEVLSDPLVTKVTVQVAEPGPA